MTRQNFPYLTSVIGLGFLASSFWPAFTTSQAVFLLLPVFVGCFLISCIASIFALSFEWTVKSFYRVGLNLLFVVLLFPTGSLGIFVKNQIFLHQLPRYQKLTDELVLRETARSTAFSTSVQLPDGYSDLGMSDRVVVGRNERNVVTVMYSSSRGCALHHEGYLFRSNDDVSDLKKKSPELGFIRRAPNWFYWAD